MGLVAFIVQLVFTNNPGSSSRHANILTQIPASIDAALSKLNLDGRTTVYAVCPACHCTYKPWFNRGSSIPIYPTHCTNKPQPENVECHESLLLAQGNSQTPKPIKTFLYHYFHDYLAGLLSRPDLEQLMDKSCDQLMESLNKPLGTFIGDVFEADFLREFEGPKPRTLFIDRQGHGRYAFSLNIDFFNVEGMKVRGATASAGIISLACLNLPFDLRFKPENMYLGIIPGPIEPHLTELNHYVKPLIDDMVDSWKRGVRISRTASHPAGRMTNSAIAAAVMDLPAARKASGLAASTSHFYCSACQCFHQSTLGRTDFKNWQRRDKESLRKHAEEWLGASTSTEREKIFKKYGTRWSELWRLPYWDPSRQLVVDAMHCILEGLAHTHFREVLGLTMSSALSPSPNVKAFHHDFTPVDRENSDMTAKEIKQVGEIHDLLMVPAQDGDTDWEMLKTKLSNKNSKPLIFVSRSLGCIPERFPRRCFKIDWAKALVQWVSYSFLATHGVVSDMTISGIGSPGPQTMSQSKLRPLK